MAEGIRRRHSRRCAAPAGACTCKPSYEAWVFHAREGRKERKTFPTFEAAKSWRRDALRAVQRGERKLPTKQTLAEAARDWLDGARTGAIRNRSGDVYKPSAVRGYEQALRLRVLPELGRRRLSEIHRADVQALVEKLMAGGHQPSTIRNTLLPLRAIYRRAVARGHVAVNPTSGVELPAVRGKRDRIASPTEAAALLALLEPDDRAIYATAMYAGLRLGELQALDWRHVDIAGGIIRVRDGWDAKEGRISTKSESGERPVPIPEVLRRELLRHRMAQGRGGEGLVFGRTVSEPFVPNTVRNRARRAWGWQPVVRRRDGREVTTWERVRGDALEPIGLHECRHTFASLMIAAGVNAKALSTYMGHSSIKVTFDKYGHLMPGNEEQAAELLDAYLEREIGAAATA